MTPDVTIAVLLILGLSFMALEAFAPSFGLLGLGGFASFIAALVMLHGQDVFFGLPVTPPYIWAMGILGSVVLGYSLYVVRTAHNARISAGAETLIGHHARVIDWTGTQGRVHVDGEDWAASSTDPLTTGDIVTITSRNALTLVVTKG